MDPPPLETLPPPASPPTPRTTALGSGSGRQSQSAHDVLALLSRMEAESEAEGPGDPGRSLLSDQVETPPGSPVAQTPAKQDEALHVYYGDNMKTFTLQEGEVSREQLLEAFGLPPSSDYELRDKGGEPVKSTSLHRYTSLSLVVRRSRRRNQHKATPEERIARAFPSVSSNDPTSPTDGGHRGQRLLNALLAGPSLSNGSDATSAADPTMMAEFDAAWDQLKRGLKPDMGPQAIRRSVSLTDISAAMGNLEVPTSARPRSNTLSSAQPLFELKLTVSRKGSMAEPLVHAEYGMAQVLVVASKHSAFPCFGLTLGRLFARSEEAASAARGSDAGQSKPLARPPSLRMAVAEDSGDFSERLPAEQIKDMTPRIFIKAIAAGSPAEKDGLQVGDLLYSINDEPIPTDSIANARSVLEQAHGKVVFEISHLLAPSPEELLALLEPPLPATPLPDDGDRLDPELSVLFDIVRTGFVRVKNVLGSGGKTLKKVAGGRPWKEYFAALRGHVLYLYSDKDKMEGPLGSQPAGGRLSVKNSLCDIAHSYKKRPHVLKLQTYNGAECLIQANTDEDMLEWIKVIQAHSNPDNDATPSHDLIKRKASQLTRRTSSSQGLHSRSSEDELRSGSPTSPVTPTSTHRGQGHERSTPHRMLSRLAGGALLRSRWQRSTENISIDLLNPFTSTIEEQSRASSSGLPMVLEKLTAEIERRGLDEEGLYRISGSKSQIDALKEGFIREGEHLDLTAVHRFNDQHAMCGLLKAWVRNLPEPLLPLEHYDSLIRASEEDADQAVEHVRQVVHRLPVSHRRTLQHLLQHLHKLMSFASKNKMSSSNIAVVFAPTLIVVSGDETQVQLQDLNSRKKLIELMLHRYEEICQAPPDSSSQVPSPAAAAEPSDAKKSTADRSSIPAIVLNRPDESSEQLPAADEDAGYVMVSGTSDEALLAHSLAAHGRSVSQEQLDGRTSNASSAAQVVATAAAVSRASEQQSDASRRRRSRSLSSYSETLLSAEDLNVSETISVTGAEPLAAGQQSEKVEGQEAPGNTSSSAVMDHVEGDARHQAQPPQPSDSKGSSIHRQRGGSAPSPYSRSPRRTTLVSGAGEEGETTASIHSNGSLKPDSGGDVAVPQPAPHQLGGRKPPRYSAIHRATTFDEPHSASTHLVEANASTRSTGSSGTVSAARRAVTLSKYLGEESMI